MGSKARSSAAARPIATARLSPLNCMRSAATAPSLPADLDAAAARARTLETTNRDVARRLDAAIETIRSVLEANDR